MAEIALKGNMKVKTLKAKLEQGLCAFLHVRKSKTSTKTVVADEIIPKNEKSKKEQIMSESAKYRYAVIVSMAQYRYYLLDADAAMKEYNCDSIEEVFSNEGNQPFYDLGEYTDFIDTIYSVGLVPVGFEDDIFDNIQYRRDTNRQMIEDYQCNYESAPEPYEVEGPLGIEKNNDAEAVFELVIDEDFDPSKLEINKPDEVIYDGKELKFLNINCNDGDFEIYIDGNPL